MFKCSNVNNYHHNNFLLGVTNVHFFGIFVDARHPFTIYVKINIKEILILKHSHLMHFLGDLTCSKRLILRMLKILILKVVATYFHIFAFFVETSRSFERYM